MTFYAVVKGRVPGIYTSYLDSRKQTDQYPGQLSKKFDTEQEAIGFLQQHNVQIKSSKNHNRSQSSHYYAVALGHKIGIYNNSVEARKQADGFKGQKIKGFPTLAEAQEYFVYYNPKFTTVAGIPKYFSDVAPPKPIPTSYYAVVVGKEVGVFNNLADAKKQTFDVVGAKMSAFPTKREAESYFNQICLNPEPAKSVESAYYSVPVGRIPGIYTSFVDARKQADGFPGQKIKGFKSKSDAVAYFKEFNKQSPISFDVAPPKESTSSKYYTVAVGKKIGIFESPLEARKSADGYPGQKIKGFARKQDAVVYFESFNPGSQPKFFSSQLKSEAKSHFDASNKDDVNTSHIRSYSSPSSPASNSLQSSSLSHSRQSSNISVSYASHMIYVRIPNPHLSKSILSTSKLDQMDWVKHGITSQSLGDRNARVNFQIDGGYFKYTVALNDRAHAEDVEEFLNGRFRDIVIPGKTEYFNMRLLGKYYGIQQPSCEEVADVHFHAILKCIMTRYPQYLEHIQARIQKFVIQVADNPGNEFIPTLKVDIVPCVYIIPNNIASFINEQKKNKKTLKNENGWEQFEEVKAFVDRVPLYNKIPVDNLMEREAFKLGFFSDFIRGKQCEDILRFSMLMSMARKLNK